MNSASWSMEPFSQDGLLVAIALGLAAILAVLTVIGMIVGARNKRQRVEAEKEEQARIEALEADGVEATTGTDTAPAPAPVAPAPVESVEPVPPTPVRDPEPLADEPIAAAAPLDASPAAEAAPAATDGAPAAEPVTRLKGLGPKIATRLSEEGIVTVDQLAALSDAEAAALDARLAPFQGRMERDRWREQARLLAAGERDAFEREFGKLG